MIWLIVEDGIVTNIIVADDAFSKTIGAEPFYAGAAIGCAYRPPELLDAEKQSKLLELSKVCNATIAEGCDVTLSDGKTGRISRTDEDQINLMSALATVQAGAAGYPYHLNGELCRVYAAADITIMATAATQHKIYHSTYCNHLNVWVRRSATVEAVQAITYGAALPVDLADNMKEVLGHVG